MFAGGHALGLMTCEAPVDQPDIALSLISCLVSVTNFLFSSCQGV